MLRVILTILVLLMGALSSAQAEEVCGLPCLDGTCPDGFSCAEDGVCWDNEICNTGFAEEGDSAQQEEDTRVVWASEGAMKRSLDSANRAQPKGGEKS